MSDTAPLSPAEQQMVLALSEAATPSGPRMPPPDQARLERIMNIVAAAGPVGAAAWRTLLHAADLTAMTTHGHGLTRLDPETRRRFVDRLSQVEALRWPLFGLTAPLKYAAAHDERVYNASHQPFPAPRPAREKPPRWEERIVDLATDPPGDVVEVDAVVIGSGAGGAPVARALAQAGHATLVLEQGRHFTRRDFDGQTFASVRKMYREGGMMIAWGNAPMQVVAGMTVGGSTTVNSGTCFRTPDDILLSWGRDFGLTALAPERMAPFFETVEKTLQVGPNPMDVLGGCARVVARGAEALGWSHAPLPRNAPGCDGQGVCCFGCPTDAKRSMNVSVIPKALEAGAMVYQGATVERILHEGGRATGVVASARRPDGQRVELRVRARVVVVAGGTIPTPLLLLQSGLANGSGQVGKNLSLHPATFQQAIFAERIDGARAVPQGYGVHQFSDRGLVMEGVFVPLDMGMTLHEPVGKRWSTLLEKYEHTASFGFMIRDTSRGRVRLGPNGKPFIRYDVNEHDRALMNFGHARLAELFLAAGAEVVMPGVAGSPEIRTRQDLQRFESAGFKRPPGDIVLSSYHPLGTARMGMDPARSVVGPTHESHDVPGLFIVDGSVVPSSLGVNPQVTIMALAERAAGIIASTLDDRKPSAVRPRPKLVAVDSVGSTQPLPEPETVPEPAPARAAWTFSEIMAGNVRELTDAVTRDVVLELDVVFRDLAPQVKSVFAGAITLHAELTGVATIGGRARRRPCKGSLQWRPLGGRRALVYELELVADDGTALEVRGAKHVLLPRVLKGATHLYTDITTPDGTVWARGLLTFDLRTLPSFLDSMALPKRSPDRAPAATPATPASAGAKRA